VARTYKKPVFWSIYGVGFTTYSLKPRKMAKVEICYRSWCSMETISIPPLNLLKAFEELFRARQRQKIDSSTYIARSRPMRILTSLLFLIGCPCSEITLPAQPPTQRIVNSEIEKWATQRVKEWQPKPSERRFDEIGWIPSLKSASSLAKKSQRPLFLFTMDGRINLGRC
jgi:hypothetical protein